MPHRSRTPSPAVIVLLAFVLVGVPAAWALSSPQDRAASENLDQQIRKLLEQRLQLIQRVVKEVEIRHDSGAVSFDTVLAAREALCRAELDLCTTRAARIKVHEQMVTLARETAVLLTRRVATGTASTTDAMRARVKLIEAEVALLRARQD